MAARDRATIRGSMGHGMPGRQPQPMASAPHCPAVIFSIHRLRCRIYLATGFTLKLEP
jgi:hypothetical protein